MKHGYTKTATTGIFCGEITRFDIPAGTLVRYGLPDCDGEPFNQWVLPENVARELSNNIHDSKHRFVTIDESNVQPMVTRKEYMEKRASHHDYYLQFATNATFQIVISRIGREKIANSTDPHMNDIPLSLWDSIGQLIKGSIKTRLKGRAENFELGKYGWSMSDAVCIAKAVAREIKAGRESVQ